LLHGSKNERMIRIGQAPSSPDGDDIKPWAVPSSFGRRYPPNGGRRGIFFVFVCAGRVLRSCAEFGCIGVCTTAAVGDDSTNRRLRNWLISSAAMAGASPPGLAVARDRSPPAGVDHLVVKRGF
jgi:hypothetical protein